MGALTLSTPGISGESSAKQYRLLLLRQMIRHANRIEFLLLQLTDYL